MVLWRTRSSIRTEQLNRRIWNSLFRGHLGATSAEQKDIPKGSCPALEKLSQIELGTSRRAVATKEDLSHEERPF